MTQKIHKHKRYTNNITTKIRKGKTRKERGKGEGGGRIGEGRMGEGGRRREGG